MAYVTGTASATLADPLIKILYSEDLHMETLDELWFTKAGMTKRETGNEEAFDRKASAPIIIKDDETLRGTPWDAVGRHGTPWPP